MQGLFSTAGLTHDRNPYGRLEKVADSFANNGMIISD
jgi:hypothetical protein